MPRIPKKRFFKQNGQSLKKKNVEFIDTIVFQSEVISTLSNIKKSKEEELLSKFHYYKNLIQKEITKRDLRTKFRWGGYSVALSFFIAVFIFQILIPSP